MPTMRCSWLGLAEDALDGAAGHACELSDAALTHAGFPGLADGLVAFAPEAHRAGRPCFELFGCLSDGEFSFHVFMIRA